MRATLTRSAAARVGTGALAPRIRRLQAQVGELQRALAACRAREAEAQRVARTDGLTGLPNRRLLEQRVDALLARHAGASSQLAVLFIDLDAFKLVNDRHGHAGPPPPQ